MKHPNLIPLPHLLPLPYRNLTRTNLIHPDPNKRDQPNTRILSLKKDNSTCRHGRDIPLRRTQSLLTNLIDHRPRPGPLGRPLKKWFAEVRPVAHETALDGPGYRGMPAVVG